MHGSRTCDCSTKLRYANYLELNVRYKYQNLVQLGVRA